MMKVIHLLLLIITIFLNLSCSSSKIDYIENLKQKKLQTVLNFLSSDTILYEIKKLSNEYQKELGFSNIRIKDSCSKVYKINLNEQYIYISFLGSMDFIKKYIYNKYFSKSLKEFDELESNRRKVKEPIYFQDLHNCNNQNSDINLRYDFFDNNILILDIFSRKNDPDGLGMHLFFYINNSLQIVDFEISGYT